MGWGKINEPEAQKIDLEKEFAEVKNRLNNSVPKEDFDALKAKNEEYGGALSALQDQLKALTTPKAQAPEEVDPTTQLISDPLGFVQNATAGDRAMAYQSRADLNEMRARQKFPGVFAEHEKELIATAEKMSLPTRAADGFWDMHIKQILGDKLIRGEFKGSYPSLMGAGSGSLPGGGGDRDGHLEPHMAEHATKRGIKADDMQAAEKLVASKDKISLENYRKMKGSANA